MSMHFPHPLQRASDVRATGGSVQSWKRCGSSGWHWSECRRTSWSRKAFCVGPDLLLCYPIYQAFDLVWYAAMNADPKSIPLSAIYREKKNKLTPITNNMIRRSMAIGPACTYWLPSLYDLRRRQANTECDIPGHWRGFYAYIADRFECCMGI